MTTTLATQVQKLGISAPRVELYEIDTGIYGGPLYRFINESPGSGSSGVLFGGHTYSPFPISGSGWQRSKEGQLPRPKVSVGNINGLFSLLCLQYDDLIGVGVKRYVTFKNFLDGEADADPAQTFPPDVYVISRKTAHDNKVVAWELCAKMDLEGRMLPRRLMLQSACPHRYRRWVSGTTFDYTKATCPYDDPVYFTKNGVATANANEDVCGKKVSDCLKRFGVTNDLPFWGFPGIDRVRTNG